MGIGVGGVLLAVSVNDFLPDCVHEWMYIAGMYSCMLSVSFLREATCRRRGVISI